MQNNEGDVTVEIKQIQGRYTGQLADDGRSIVGGGAVIMAIVQAAQAWTLIDAKTFLVLNGYAIVIRLIIVTAGPAHRHG